VETASACLILDRFAERVRFLTAKIPFGMIYHEMRGRCNCSKSKGSPDKHDKERCGVAEDVCCSLEDEVRPFHKAGSWLDKRCGC
jgi:hypothetical protein